MLKAKSLGSAGSAVDLITVSAASNATPIVITLGANHGLKNGDRLAIAGITGNTAANGEWTLGSVGATTATLIGSVGNGAFGGTARACQIFDLTPTMKGHSGVLQVGGNLVGTVTLTAFNSLTEFTANDNSLVGAVQAPIVSPGIQGITNVNSTSASSATKATSALVLGLTNAGVEAEVLIPRYLHATISAYTSGTLSLSVQA